MKGSIAANRCVLEADDDYSVNSSDWKAPAACQLQLK